MDGGPEKLISDGLKADSWSLWTVADNGLYFADWAKKPSQIEFMDFRSGRVSLVGKMQGQAFEGLTLSPDQKYIVYSQRERDEHDILMTKLPQ